MLELLAQQMLMSTAVDLTGLFFLQFVHLLNKHMLIIHLWICGVIMLIPNRGSFI